MDFDLSFVIRIYDISTAKKSSKINNNFLKP